MFEIDDFKVQVGSNIFQGQQHKLQTGSIVELFAESEESLEDFIFLLSGLLTRIRRTDPAPKNQILRVEHQYAPETLKFIKLNNKFVYDLSDIVRAQQIGTIFGNPELYILGNTVSEEFAYSFAAVEKPLPDLQALKRYGLFGKTNYRTEHLSAGERHRLNWACTLELNPSVIIADLSQSNLDIEFIDNLVEWLKEKNEQRVIIVHGLPRGIFGNFNTEQWYFDSGSLFYTNPDTTKFPNVIDQQNRIQTVFKSRNVDISETILKVENLRRKSITKGISFELKKSEVLQIHGRNGIGKTTLGKMLTNQIHKDEIEGSTTPELYQLKVVMSFQYPERTFIESRTGNILRRTSLLDICGLSASDHDLHPRKLAFSKQKLISVAFALSESLDYAILDEPTAGMDFEDKLRFVKLLNTFNSLSVLIFTHDPALEKIGRILNWEDISP